MVTSNNYPRAYFFRETENTYEPYGIWENNFKRLMGIEGKCLEEGKRAKPFSGKRNRKFFTRFKRNHPTQMILLHFNGNARDQRFDMENFFNGHFIYYNGDKILSMVPAESGTTSIHVSDVSLFKENVGRYGKLNDDIGLCKLDESGKPNWYKSEQVKLVSVNKENNTIKVHRGYLGTEPLSFKPGEGYEPKTDKADHMIYPIWDEPVKGETNQLGWMGEIIGPTARISVKKGKEILYVTNTTQFQELIQIIDGPVKTSIDGDVLKIVPEYEDAEKIHFSIEDIHCDGMDLLVILTMRGNDMENYPSNWAV
jgi:hypothetical protein